jgi:FtsZ-binding cell division protein ZapB
MNANELADELTKMFRGEEYDRLIHEIPDMLRQQQNEIEDLKNANRFIQNFAEEQHKRAVALEAETEALKELLANEGIVVGHDYLNNCIATMRKAQEK